MFGAYSHKGAGDFVFVKASGEPWEPSDQKGRMEDACIKAGINPPFTFHGHRPALPGGAGLSVFSRIHAG